MKKIRNLMIALFAVVLLAGCSMKENFSLNITSDKKVGVAVKVAVDGEGIDQMLSLQNMDDTTTETKTYTSQERLAYMKENACQDAEEGYTCETYQDGDFYGVVMKSDTVDIDTITGTSTSKIDISNMTGDLSDGKLFVKDGDVYKSNLTYNAASESELGEYSSYADSFIIEFEVLLPNKSISNNADKVSSDGLTLTWDLSKGSKDIDFSFKFDGTSNSNVNNNTNNNSNNNTNGVAENINNTRETVRNTTDTILGMSKTVFIIVIVSVVLGLALLSVLIIIFARKSSNTKNSSNNTASQETAKLFKNPELSTSTEGKAESTSVEEAKEEPKKEE